MKGYKKGNFTVDKWKPIIPEVLQMLCASTIQVCFSNFEAIMFKAFFSINFFTALRISELVPHNRVDKYGLQLSDLIIQENVVKILVHTPSCFGPKKEQLTGHTQKM